MTANGTELEVLLGDQLVGRSISDSSQTQLIWDQQWRQTGFPLSPSLPWEKDDLPTGSVLKNFFENMLPEGSAFEHLLQYSQISRSNVLALALRLGNDLPGAVRLRLAGVTENPVEDAFRPISNEELNERMLQMESVPIDIWDGKPRLSVAGMQPKLNLLELNGQLGLCNGTRLASDRILKFSSDAVPSLLLNEFLTMQLAAGLGWPVARVQLRRFNSMRALEILRFDRRLVTDAKGPKVLRRHVIDACQALGLPSSFKYERNFGDGRDVQHIRDGVSLGKLFSLSKYAVSPEHFEKNLFDWMLFSIIVGNVDAHGKNFSFFYGPQGLEAAPWYDLVSVALVPGISHTLTLAVGDVFEWDELHALQILETADEIGRTRAWVQVRLGYVLESMENFLPLTISAFTPENAKEDRFLTDWKNFMEKRLGYWHQQWEIMPKITI